ncbi:hypothetical protein ES705_46820 [subsurface metagenome]
MSLYCGKRDNLVFLYLLVTPAKAVERISTHEQDRRLACHFTKVNKVTELLRWYNRLRDIPLKKMEKNKKYDMGKNNLLEEKI